MRGLDASIDRGGSRVTRWKPGVRLVLTSVALIPMLGIALLTVASASASWTNRQYAISAAADAARLRTIAQARLQANDAAVPIIIMGQGLQLNLTESEVSMLTGIDLMKGPISLPTAATLIRSNPILSSTPTLAAEVQAAETLIGQLESGTINGQQAGSESVTLPDSLGTDVDNLWRAEFSHLRNRLRSWKAPEQIETHLSALRQAFDAFDEGIYADRDSVDVMEGIGGIPTRLELIQDAAQFSAAESQFVTGLGPAGNAAWHAQQTDPQHLGFVNQVEGPAIKLAINGGTPPYSTNQYLAGIAVRETVADVTDISNVVQAASSDLQREFDNQAVSARNQFAFDTGLLAALVLVSLGGVTAAGRFLTKPLNNLENAARRIHTGDFDLCDLPELGPREVVTTTEAFNVMTSTLKLIEHKTIALAEEDLTHPYVRTPLPGRTGQALQAAVERLVFRIREREMQRQQLHHSATHDPLTGLLNRAATLDHLTTDVDRRRRHGERVAVLFADLNGLKPLNDTYGHEAGDMAIRLTSEALAEAMDPCDVVGRLGGDEFMIVLCAEHSLDPTAAVKKVHDALALRAIPIPGGLSVPLEASVGTALAQCDALTDPMSLARQADEAMYEAKRAARATREHMAGAMPVTRPASHLAPPHARHAAPPEVPAPWGPPASHLPPPSRAPSWVSPQPPASPWPPPVPDPVVHAPVVHPPVVHPPVVHPLSPVGPAPVGAAPVGAAPVGAAPVGVAPVGAAPVGAAPVVHPPVVHPPAPVGHAAALVAQSGNDLAEAALAVAHAANALAAAISKKTRPRGNPSLH